jgi:hypothetical protein
MVPRAHADLGRLAERIPPWIWRGASRFYGYIGNPDPLTRAEIHRVLVRSLAAHHWPRLMQEPTFISYSAAMEGRWRAFWGWGCELEACFVPVEGDQVHWRVHFVPLLKSCYVSDLRVVCAHLTGLASDACTAEAVGADVAQALYELLHKPAVSSC